MGRGRKGGVERKVVQRVPYPDLPRRQGRLLEGFKSRVAVVRKLRCHVLGVEGWVNGRDNVQFSTQQ